MVYTSLGSTSRFSESRSRIGGGHRGIHGQPHHPSEPALRTPFSIVSRRSSASSSWMETSASRVTRKGWDWTTSIPGNSEPTFAATSCSRRRKMRPSARTASAAERSSRNRGRVAGSLTRANRSVPGGVADHEGEVQAHVGDVGERPARIHGKGRQDGKDDFLEIAVSFGLLPGGERGVVHEPDARPASSSGRSSLQARARLMHQLL